MFLLSAQNNFYIVLSSYVQGHVKKYSGLNFMSSVDFHASKIWMSFWKIGFEQVSKSFSGRNNSLEPSVFRLSNSLPYGVDESRELRALISRVLG